jgi:hypothetical protein
LEALIRESRDQSSNHRYVLERLASTLTASRPADGVVGTPFDRLKMHMAQTMMPDRSQSPLARPVVSVNGVGALDLA